MVMMVYGLLVGCVFFVVSIFSVSVQVGVVFGVIWVIYLVGQKQVQFVVINNDDNSIWFIQLWVENVDGQ